jgi:CHAT domain-containing protein
VVDRWREAVTLEHIGKVYSNLGERQKALAYYEQALPIHRAVGNRTGEAETVEKLMREWSALSKPRLAVFYGKQAVNLYQQLRADIRGLPKDLQHSYLLTVGGTYRFLAEILVAQGRLPEAQQVLGLLKQEEYLEFVRRDSSAASSLDFRATSTPTEAEWQRRYATVAAQVAELGRRRGELEARGDRTAEEAAELAHLDADLEIAGKAFQDFLDQLAKEFTTNDSRVHVVREAQGLMPVLRELGAGTVALYTVVGEKSVSIMLITPDVEKAGEYQIAKAELASKVQAFQEALKHPHQDPRPLAQELYRIVVGPIAKDLEQARAKTLMWSLDGVLRYLPIAALHDGEMYLLERYRSVVFTAASYARLKDQPSPRWRGLGLGVSRASEGFRALPGVPFELRGIFRDEQSSEGVIPGTVLLDEAFTAEAMRTAIRKGASLVHVASHFHLAPGNETESFLLLGDKDKTKNHLTLAQVRDSNNLFGGVELLTLSACETATGGRADGSEFEGFAVLAQLQGAKSVLATLWSVEDASTSPSHVVPIDLHSVTVIAKKVSGFPRGMKKLEMEFSDSGFSKAGVSAPRGKYQVLIAFTDKLGRTARAQADFTIEN